MNLAENLERSAFYFPNRPAILEEGREVSYLEFNQESNRVATALIGLGVHPGDHVALCAPNSFRWFAFYFGVLKAGGIAVTLPGTLTHSELTHLLDDARPKVLFTTDEKLNALGDRRDHPFLKKIICSGGDMPYDRLTERGLTHSRPLISIVRTQQPSYTQGGRRAFPRESC